jgi:hypothetical protein
MKAEEWDHSTNSSAMSGYLGGIRTTRKWYCLALACMRLIWDRLPQHCRTALETTERYVERQASNSDRARARALLTQGLSPVETATYWASCAPTDINPAGRGILYQVREILAAGQPAEAARTADRELGRLLREIFPNPFREVRIEPAWLRWSDGAVRHIAETINDEGDFARVPILADALEEAGCTDEHLLGHLRAGGPHVRGCWVVDLLIGTK